VTCAPAKICCIVTHSSDFEGLRFVTYHRRKTFQIHPIPSHSHIKKTTTRQRKPCYYIQRMKAASNKKSHALLITPPLYQSASNFRKRQNIENTVKFFKDLVSEPLCQELMKILFVSNTVSVNYKAADQKIAQLVQQCNEDFQMELQQFLNNTKEQKQQDLSDVKKRIRIIKLSSYLEKRHIKQMRGKFPSLAPDNLRMALRQDRDVEKCMKMVEMQQKLKEETISETRTPSKISVEFKGCNCCCDEEKKLVIFPVCKHEYCCEECTQKLTVCPLCRQSVKPQKSTNFDSINIINSTRETESFQCPSFKS
jgi:hypothetical protein